MSRTPKMRHCFNCGADLGVYADFDPLDNCGERECMRAAADAEAQEREDAHEQLDQDNGWGRYP
jgi:hypothetical protein